MQNKEVLVDVSGIRADVFLSEKLSLSRSHVKNLMDEGCVLLNDIIVKPRDLTKTGSVYIVLIKEPKPISVIPKDIPLDVIYQDKDIAVINKQQGLTVHAGSGTDDNTLVNALLYNLDSLSGINGEIRPGIVHRIDKDTSGLLVVAKNDNAHLSLSSQIEKKTCKRTYIALLEGVLKSDSGVIETFIERSTKNRTMMTVSNKGRKAITHYEVLKRYENFTLCKFMLETGRTHQIRVHCAYLKHPIVGDLTYGYKKQKFNLNGQLLHAIKLELNHPVSNERLTFEAPIPDYFLNVLNKIK